MSMYVPMNRVHQSRTLKPKYAKTQATPQAVRLDPAWDAKRDIFPGSVLSRKAKGYVTLCDGTNAPAGLSANFVAPVYGIDEMPGTAGDGDMAMWVLGGDAVFEVSAPAFDKAADWSGAASKLDEGKAVYLKANADGLLTVEDAEVPTKDTAARLIGVEGDRTIYVAGLL